jgi:hypothetical protein
VKRAIVGDFDGYNSKSLKDFIYGVIKAARLQGAEEMIYARPPC